MRKKSLVGLVSAGIGMVFSVLLAGGCSSSRYELAENWVALDSDTPLFFAEYDVFYLYPSQVESADDPAYVNRMQGMVGDNLRREVEHRLPAYFGAKARRFVPFVFQLPHERYCELLAAGSAADEPIDYMNSPLAPAIKDAAEALQYYLKHCNRVGQPFILYGAEQGALILYEAMKQCSDITPENGFIAAYFLGVPDITAERIERDFGSRGIKPAKGFNDVGVIAVCNTRLPGEPLENTFGGPGRYVINPLNWRTDDVPAEPAENLGSVLSDSGGARLGSPFKTIPRFCGAAVDPENGVLNITHIVPPYEWKLGEREFHSDVWGLFAVNIRQNVGDRVRTYILRQRGMKNSDQD